MTLVHTLDAESGMAWWNSLSESDRRYWLDMARTACPADAWANFKRAEKVREAALPGGPACGVSASAAGVEFSTYPDGNHGDNQTQTTDKAVS